MASQIGFEALAAALKPPAAIDYLQFVEDNITIGEGAFPGPYSRVLFPYFDSVLSALSPSDPCRYVTLQASAQVGKTLIATAFALGSVTLGRGLTLLLHPTEENALRYSKIKLEALMRSTPIVADHFPKRSRDSQSAILFKQRDDGMAALLISGANSPASLSQITVSNLVMDDVAKYESSAAGDPEVMADRGRQDISDQHAACRAWVPDYAKLHGRLAGDAFRAVSALRRDAGARMGQHARRARYRSSRRRTLQLHRMRRYYRRVSPATHMLAGFEWRAQNPSAKSHHRSFWIWSAYSYLQTWEQIAREYIKTKGDPSGEQTFMNDTVGKAYEVQGTGRPWEELKARAAKSHYSRGTVPQGALILTIGVDCQLDRVEWVALAHGRQFKRYVVDYGTISKHISEPDCQHNIDALMNRTWPNYCGVSMPVSLTAVDANYSTDDVLAYARRYPSSKLIAVRGNPGDAAPRIARIRRERNEKKGTPLKYSNRFFNLGVNQFKFSLYRDLQKDDPSAPGYFSFPTGLEDRFFQELVSETRVAKKIAGQTIWRWEKPDRQANEMLDCAIYSTAAALKYGINGMSEPGWRYLEAKYDPPGEQPAPVARASMAQKLIDRSRQKQYPIRRL